MFDTPLREQRVPRLAIVILFVTLLVASAVAPAAGAAAMQDDGDETDTATPTEPDNTTDGNETTTNQDAPSIAEGVRITPETYDEDYLETTVRESDAVYNTSGPFATFTLSEPAEAARIEQSGAEAKLLGDGSVVRVEYDDDAAGATQSTLFTLELFFADGSDTSVDLYATSTAVSVEAAEYSEYSGLIDYINRQAEGEGYEQNPEGAKNYVEQKEEQAEWLDQLYTKHAIAFIGMLMALARNPFFYFTGIAIIAALTIYWARKHGWILRLQQIVESRAELMRSAVRQDWEERQNAAAKHRIEDVTEIGTNAARYWREVGVETVDDMCEIAAKGIVKVDENGRIETDENDTVVFAHHGADDLLEVDPLTEEQLREQTWLKPLILEGRLHATTALSNIDSALLVAEKEYNRGNEVRETRRAVSELVDRLKGERDYENADTSSNAPRTDRDPSFGPSPTGGD